MVKTFRLEEFGYEVELGKFAQQADGAAWLKHGGTVLLSTACMAPSEEFPGFLPLTVEYRELFSAAGKIPGGYYKREGKPSDREVLIGRLVDRSIRPLFPYNFFDQLQIVTTVYSVDKEHSPNAMALVASSIALTISKIPFMGPVGAVEICKIDGKWIINPPHQESLRSSARLVFAGTEEGINMVEGSCQEISEQDFIDALFMSHEAIKKLVAWQKEIQKEMGAEKHKIVDPFDWKSWELKVDTFLTEDKVRNLYIEDKVARNNYLDELQKEFMDTHTQEVEEAEVPVKALDYLFDQSLQRKLSELIVTLGKRVDNRSFDQIRKITTEVGLLPCNHGSALFKRGRTQALVSVTLGGGQDEQKTETIMSDTADDGRFMLHYNFPPFSVGEVRPMRGPGRREVGHGHLAASAIRQVLPAKEDFPYTIRVVADMLESDGSTSMATTCGATMALMDAGVPIKKMVGGVAMGLLQSNKGTFQVLSDISGFEDAFGLMDFKVTGTDNGITAIQMDIKYKGGFSRAVFESALEQARAGRMYILGEMRKVMSKPNPNLSSLVPKLVTLKVETDKIGAIIGTGGKTIREIIDKTKTNIDIEPDGLVKIFGGPDADIDLAINWVKTLAGQIEVGARYTGKIKRIAEFGLFVELVPGLDGLVHVSLIPRDKQRNFAQYYKVDEIVHVEVVDYDKATGRIRLRLLEDN
ncbi:MAG TPA: polyribonucleotide nucleotidyltransferase [Candidatus Babeliales bacterium]|nr:polyribonucleotide nucleotidyltransferase [Candidatus Babeliales bacterium]